MDLKLIGKLFGLGLALAISALVLAAGDEGGSGGPAQGCTVTLQPGQSI